MMARRQLDYEAELGRARCHHLVMEKKRTSCVTDGATGCWLFSGSLNTDGYGQVSSPARALARPQLTSAEVTAKRNSAMQQRGRQSLSAFLLHIVAFVGSRGHGPGQGLQVSHLCDRRSCFNPDHLRPETPQVNNSRKGCPGPIFCSVHGHLIVDLCAHEPRCVRAPRDDVNCCLAIRESDARWGSRTNSVQTNASTASAGSATTQRGSRPSQALLSWMSRASESFDGARELEAAAAEGLLDGI